MKFKFFLPLIAVSVSVFSFSATALAELSAMDLEKITIKTIAQYNNLAQMKSCYDGEQDSPPHTTCAFSHSFTVKYFRDNNEQDVRERESYRVVFIAGTARRAQNPEQIMSEKGKMNYVMDANGNFYIFNEKQKEEIRHSSFFAGGKVASAGDLKLQNGKILDIDGNSGHYEMNDEILKNVLDYLKQQGVTL